jgi:hypothetical protein
MLHYQNKKRLNAHFTHKVKSLLPPNLVQGNPLNLFPPLQIECHRILDGHLFFYDPWSMYMYDIHGCHV